MKVFYHICCMGNWSDVVDEQMRLLKHVGIIEVNSFILGNLHEANQCKTIAKWRGVGMNILGTSIRHDECEHPTLLELQRWAKDNGGEVMYLHTKGVSDPASIIKKRWRRMMQAYTIANWKENLALLEKGHDCVGAAWQESRDFPHFCGNFWMASCDWIRKLPELRSYRLRYRADDPRFAGRPWWSMHCETWIGAEPNCNPHSICGRNLILWGDDAFMYSADVDGFRYEE